jgi:hypothetical protein
MAEIGTHKPLDAVAFPREEPGQHDGGGKPERTHETAAEQVREAHESEEARLARASIRDKMVDIGRGNQQAGRQGQ